MKGRCLNPSDVSYAHYGGRGISICDRWVDSFENFYADMGDPPSPHHSIDRIDNDGDYEPENCRWATHAEQRNNRRSKRSATLGGVTLPLKEWCTELGASYQLVRARIDRGWSDEDAFMVPPWQRRKQT